MKWFLDLTTRTKLFLGFSLMILLLATVLGTAYTTITAIQESQQALFAQDFATALDLVELKSDLNRTRVALLSMLVAPEQAERERWREEITDSAAGIDKLLASLTERSRTDPALARKLGEYQSLQAAFRATREQQVALIFAGDTEEARKLFPLQTERYEQMRDIASQLGEAKVHSAQRRLEESERTAQNSVFIFGVSGITALLLGVALAVFLSRLIANPLREISQAAERIAAGDLTVSLAPSNSRQDEIGTLTQAFARMNQSLQQMARVAEQIAAGNLAVQVGPQSEKDILGTAFATMVENLLRVTREIREGVNVLGTAASEILAVTTQVAAGAAETATAISQAATTAEEVKQTSQVSTQKAKYVSESAQKAAQVSQNGKQAVEDSTTVMTRIREQMASIAESIVRLSEQSHVIGEIMTTVNDLADQSNLLAVNAAIEAAKAGEYGKGFAVVAQEVKGLAEQSKQATAQVRTILHDIQQAISAAVMVTEQGSKAVEAGGQQIGGAGEAIRLLVEQVTEAAQAATQIAASSQQQSVGMDQVALAMENIKQASTQNVAATRQAEAAAHNLREVGQQLLQLVDRYQVQ